MTSRARTAAFATGALLLAAAAFVPVPSTPATASAEAPSAPGPAMDLSAYSEAPLDQPLPLLFIHHSIGGQWLAEPGSQIGEHNLWERHPNGGNLRGALQEAGFEVHQATYGSAVGEHTDLFDWLPKMSDQMDRILATDRQDTVHDDGVVNRVVLFKSCYPNSKLEGPGRPPGDAGGPELTVANAKATFRALRPVLARHPDTLFVYVTAPPHAPRLPDEPAWKWLARRLTGRVFDPVESGAWARELNDWLKNPDGWLEGYPHQNIAVFDYFDVLTDDGSADVSRYATGDGEDSHPSSEGNRRATERMVPWLLRVVRRAGLAP